jgi:predicted aminopeptidase
MQIFSKIFFLLILLFLSACSDISYLTSASINQIRILSARTDIKEALNSPNKLADIRPKDLTEKTFNKKLKLIILALKFARTQGLKTGGAYSSYADIKEKPIWVLLACKKNTFKLHYWNYPIVGKVPYKGYFDLDTAREVAKDFLADNYDVSIRTASAFSTLGWFDDPILPSMIKLNYLELTNTIFHELLHRNFWLPSAVAFNETLASVIAHEINVNFYRELSKEVLDQKSSIFTKKEVLNLYKESLLSHQHYYKTSRSIRAFYISRKQHSQQKIDKKSESPELTDILKGTSLNLKNNNAQIMQQKLYYTGSRLFYRNWRRRNFELKRFLTSLKIINNQKPFKHLRQMLRK